MVTLAWICETWKFVLVPVTEELVFRGCYARLAQHTNSSLPLLVDVAFGLGHVGLSDLEYVGSAPDKSCPYIRCVVHESRPIWKKCIPFLPVTAQEIFIATQGIQRKWGKTLSRILSKLTFTSLSSFRIFTPAFKSDGLFGAILAHAIVNLQALLLYSLLPNLRDDDKT